MIEFDVELKEIERVIENTSEETEVKVNWTKVWGKKYPVLTIYKQKVDTKEYSIKIREMINSLKNKYGYIS